MTREDMVDGIAQAISDSFDVDWNSHDGAEAVVRDCGVWELYEALLSAEETLGHISATGYAGPAKRHGDYARQALPTVQAALAKARGEQ